MVTPCGFWGQNWPGGQVGRLAPAGRGSGWADLSPPRQGVRGAPALQHAHGHLGSPEEKGRGQAQSAGLGKIRCAAPQARGQGDTEEPPGEAGGRKSALGGRRPGLLQEGRLP